MSSRDPRQRARRRNAAARYDPTGADSKAISLYNESLAYLNGDGVPRDDQKSFELNKRAAFLGDHDAILAMGWYFTHGIGVERDEDESRRWYRESARLGEPRAMFSLGGSFYESGDWEAARGWLERAVEAGHERARFWLGKLYWRGAGVEKDRKRAMRLFEQAAAHKVTEARRFLSLRSALLKASRRT